MNPLERLISVVAPHTCLSCGKEDTILCENCAETYLSALPSRCYRCHIATSQFAVCPKCRRSVAPKHVWIATEYSGVAKDLIHCFKFERAREAHKPIAKLLDQRLPLLPKDTVVTYLPTTPSRVRVRGYDQSRLIAKEFAYRRGLLCDDLLIRVASTRQVGAGRQTRFDQLREAFEAKHPEKAQGQRVLLIDDVLTTGASIESASLVLKDSGAAVIDVAVFAH